MANRLSWKFLRKNDLFHLRLWLESVLDLKYFKPGWFAIFWSDYNGENKMKKKACWFLKKFKAREITILNKLYLLVKLGVFAYLRSATFQWP